MLTNSRFIGHSPLTKQPKFNTKTPRKVSDAQTNVSSSFSSHNSSFSSISSLPYNFYTTNELILLKIYSIQIKTPKYYDKSNPSANNFYFLSRKKIFLWVNDVLSSLSISQINKYSIYHRFTYAYSTITSLLYNQNKFYIKDQFKILIVSIFLLCYKIEGFTIHKFPIASMINTFLKSVTMNAIDIKNEIKKMEIEICKLLNYDIYLLEHNQFQITLILLELLKEKFMLEDKYYEEVYGIVNQVNKYIDNASHNEINFELLPIEKGMIAVFAGIIKMNNEKLSKEILKYVDYFYSELNVVRSLFHEKNMIKYSKHYMRKINKETK